MRTARKMIYVSTLLILLVLIVSIILLYMGCDFNYTFTISLSLECGLLVMLVQSIISFNSEKEIIVSQIYDLYFDLYRTFYNVKSQRILLHYNMFTIYKKIYSLSSIYSSILTRYHGFFIEKDKLYYKLNRRIKNPEFFIANNIYLNIFHPFNYKRFNKYALPYMKEIEIFLIELDKERFERDKNEMVAAYNYVWKKKKTI